MRTVLCILLTFCALSSAYAGFGWKAEIRPVQFDNTYAVALPTDVVAHTRDDLGDIRLYAANGKEIPYVIYREEALSYSSMFKDYGIITNKTAVKGSGKTQEKLTVLELENTRREPIDNLCLVIRNTDVIKTAVLSGSDNGTTWFAIKSNYTFQSMYSESQTSEVMRISFPLSDYRYLRLEIDDNTTPPVQIISAGYYDTRSETGKYTEITQGIMKTAETESTKKTVITIEFPYAYRIDKITFAIESPEFYHRYAVVKFVSGDPDYPYTPTHNIILSPNSDNVLTVPSIRAKKIEISIENKDDTPLKVTAVKSFQLNTYLAAELKKDTVYTMNFGDKGITRPQYDIVHRITEMKIAAQPAELQTIVEIPKVKPGFFGSPMFLWITLILVGGLLGYFAVTMIKEMKKK